MCCFSIDSTYKLIEINCDKKAQQFMKSCYNLQIDYKVMEIINLC